MGQEENSEVRRRQLEIEHQVREEMSKNDITQNDMRRLFDELTQQRNAMQNWSAQVENRFVDDTTSDEEMREKIDTLAREMVRMQDIMTWALERSEARTDEISKKTIEHMKAINESRIEQKTTVAVEEQPKETLERREKEKFNLEERARLTKADYRPMTKWKMNFQHLDEFDDFEQWRRTVDEWEICNRDMQEEHKIIYLKSEIARRKNKNQDASLFYLRYCKEEKEFRADLLWKPHLTDILDKMGE